MEKLTRAQYRTNSLLSTVLLIVLLLFTKIGVGQAVIFSQLMCLLWCFKDLFVQSSSEEKK